MTATAEPGGTIPAPGLRETADIWWDSGSDPVISWDAAGLAFWLAEGSGGTGRLELVQLDAPAADPRVVAVALRDGLAACDFPPTGSGVPPGRAAATLRVAGIEV